MNAQQQVVVLGNVDPVDDDTQSALAIRSAGWWDRAELDEHWPVTNSEAARLLHLGGGFDVDADDLIGLVGRKLIPLPGKGESGWEWSASDVMKACQVLEWRGQWTFGTVHDAKRDPVELVLQLARENGKVEQLTVGPDGVLYDVAHLLRTLMLCDSAAGRLKIVTLLRAVLEVEHGVIV